MINIYTKIIIYQYGVFFNPAHAIFLFGARAARNHTFRVSENVWEMPAEETGSGYAKNKIISH